MSKSKPKTKAQLDKATDARLRKVYNISLSDYEYLLNLNNGGCWICGRPAANNRLHVDHDHGWKKVKIVSTKSNDEWHSSAAYNGQYYFAIDTKKSLSRLKLKRILLRASVRGLLCYSHNAGLQKFSDSPRWLENGAQYLRKFEVRNPLIGRP